MTKPTCIRALALACLLAAPAGAADLLQYAGPDGTLRTVPVVILQKATETEFKARIRVAGRVRTLKIPTRMVVSFSRGSSDDINQWAKSLAKARRLMAAGQIATVGTAAGAEEMFTKIAYSMEKGTPHQEKTEAIAPWHNMYALFHLIEARYALGKQKPEKLAAALSDIEQFAKRSASRYGKTIKWEVPGPQGSINTAKVYCWGENRLTTEVMMLKARILAAQGKRDEAVAAYDALLAHIARNQLSPILLAQATMEKADLQATGLDTEKQENIFRSAGNRLASLAGSQPDLFGKQVLRARSNRALLRGADLLLDSAREGKLSYDPPLERFRTLKASKGGQDPALYMGAQAGIGICLTEKGQGSQAYRALLDVIVNGHEYPEQMARALFYMTKAAPLYAKEIEAGGGRGDFLRAEAERWRADLDQRYPGSKWALKARSK